MVDAHDHAHPHPHAHSHDDPQNENPDAGQGPVVLDIGGDIGALIVVMPAALSGTEIEIRPAGDSESADPAVHRPHVAVVARPLGGRAVPSLVFPELGQGRYELYIRPAGEVQLTVDISGGVVTEAAWPTSG